MKWILSILYKGMMIGNIGYMGFDIQIDTKENCEAIATMLREHMTKENQYTVECIGR